MKAQITDDMKETRLIAAAQSMSGLQIAEITGKRHNERNFALAEVGAHNFVATSYEGCKFNLYPQKLIQTMLVSGQNRNILMRTVMITKWTQLGRIFLYETLKKADILPLIER